MATKLDPKAHWENIYQTKSPNDLSWFQPKPTHSISLITHTTVDRQATIVDVGSGATTLVAALLDAGYTNIFAVDIAASALTRAKAHLGSRADQVNWLEADVMRLQFPENSVDVWHDRAVFHFLTRTCDR